MLIEHTVVDCYGPSSEGTHGKAGKEQKCVFWSRFSGTQAFSQCQDFRLKNKQQQQKLKLCLYPAMTAIDLTRHYPSYKHCLTQVVTTRYSRSGDLVLVQPPCCQLGQGGSYYLGISSLPAQGNALPSRKYGAISQQPPTKLVLGGENLLGSYVGIQTQQEKLQQHLRLGREQLFRREEKLKK